MIYSQQNETHGKVTYPLTGVYAHGELETLLDNDIISTDTLSLATKHMDAANGMVTYVANDIARNENGKTMSVRVYLWSTGGLVRGLVVSDEDNESIAYALDRFERLSPTL